MPLICTPQDILLTLHPTHRNRHWPLWSVGCAMSSCTVQWLRLKTVGRRHYIFHLYTTPIFDFLSLESYAGCVTYAHKLPDALTFCFLWLTACKHESLQKRQHDLKWRRPRKVPQVRLEEHQVHRAGAPSVRQESCSVRRGRGQCRWRRMSRVCCERE